MQNSRRRKNVLFLMVLAALGGEARRKKGYESLRIAGPFIALHELEAQLSASMPEAEKQRELARVKEVVNEFVPVGFLMFAPELKLWVGAQVVKRIVSTGWELPRDPKALAFIQTMFTLADSINLPSPPGQHLLDFIVHSADTLRKKHGLFV